MVLTKQSMPLALKTYLISEHVALNHHIEQALKAHACMHRDVDYVVTRW